ncbi:hypothetical protein VTO73DRAFT_13135 [Trametes versicolor]
MAAENINSLLSSVPKLSADNYQDWKFAVQMVMRRAGCLSVANGTEERPTTREKSEQWDKSAEQALTIIGLTVNPDQYHYIRDAKNGPEAWSALRGVYEKNSRANRFFRNLSHVLFADLGHRRAALCPPSLVCALLVQPTAGVPLDLARVAVPVDADVNIATKELKHLSKRQKAARAAILKATAQTLRVLTGITKDGYWPDYVKGVPRANMTTGEPYFNTHFAASDGVTNKVNVNLLRQVTYDVTKDFYGMGPGLHLWLEAEDIPFAEALVFALTMESWLNFKHEYEEVHGVDPNPLLDISQMSDEASGPDPNSGETHEDGVFEVIRPNWGSEKYDAVLKWRRERHARKLTPNQVQSQKYRVQTSGRTTDVPSAIAPYNFGINQEWLDARKDTDTYRTLLADGGNYPSAASFEGDDGDDDEEDEPEQNRGGATEQREEGTAA